MSRRLFTLFFALFIGSLACSSPAPAIPVVESVSFQAANPSKDASGNYVQIATVSAHSAGGAIIQLLAHVPQQNGVAFADVILAIPSGTPSPFAFQLTIAGAAPAGTYNIEIKAVDSANTQSAAFPTTITLQ